MKDWCTSFPEHWFAWDGFFRWKKVYIGDCCKKHDDKCSTGQFLKCLREKKIVGNLLITLGGSLGCWIQYTKNMIKRV